MATHSSILAWRIQGQRGLVGCRLWGRRVRHDSGDLAAAAAAAAAVAAEISSRKLEIPRRTFHAKMDTIKDRNDMDLTEAGGIKKRRQEYTEELCKKDLNDPENYDGAITHPEPHTLECEIKRASGSITTNKASGDNGIPVELFQTLKDDAVKVLHTICHHIGKLSSGHRTRKVSFHSNPKERQCQRMFKLLHNCTHLIC